MKIFNIRTEPLQLSLKRPFTISRGSREIVKNVLIHFEADGITGIGEAAPNHRYQETQESALKYLQSFGNYKTGNPFDVDILVDHMERQGSGEYAAKAGLEMALFDWIGKKLQLPLYKLLQAPGPVGPRTTFTIGIDRPDLIKEKVAEAASYPLLKVKLGTDYDKDIIAAIREVSDKPVLVDANESWQTVDQALDMIRYLEDRNVYVIEQPMPSSCIKEMEIVRKHSSIPLFADESLTGKKSIKEIAACFHGINIKLMKTGSISSSLKLMHRARKEGLSIMAGCMVESAIADTASALVSMWADYADLDGHLLIKENPFDGLQINPGGHVTLRNSPGLGLVKTQG